MPDVEPVIHSFARRQAVACPRPFEPAEQAALAFLECKCLSSYLTGCVWPDSPVFRLLGQLLGARVTTALRRRAVSSLPKEAVHSFPTIDAGRTAAAAFGWRGIEDWLWELDDHRFSVRSAREGLAGCDTVHGFEHASLELFQAAKALGKRTVLHVASIHPTFHDRIFDRAYERHPEFKDSTAWRLRERRHCRDARRIAEYAVADVLVSNSSFTTRSLVEFGVPVDRIEQVLLGVRGASRSGDPNASPVRSGALRVLFAGKISFHKGCHLLFEAWRAGVSPAATLTMAGRNELPLSTIPAGTELVGAVSQDSLFQLTHDCDLLVLPTLCDTFGLVIAEALANGLPVLTTANAGAADLVVEDVNGWVVPAGDVDALSSRLAWCERHLDVLRTMRSSARETATPRSWDDYRGELRSVLSRRGVL